jgi:hypothetical protein
MLEMYLGRIVFDTHDSLEHLHLIEKLCGPMPQSLLRLSPKSCDLVQRGLGMCSTTPDAPDEEFCKISDIQRKRTYFLNFQSLKSANNSAFRIELCITHDALQILSKSCP